MSQITLHDLEEIWYVLMEAHEKTAIILQKDITWWELCAPATILSYKIKAEK